MTLEQSFKGWVRLRKGIQTGKGNNMNESERSVKQNEFGQLLVAVYGWGKSAYRWGKVKKTFISSGTEMFCSELVHGKKEYME